MAIYPRTSGKGGTNPYRKTADLIDHVEADLGGPERFSAAEQQIIRHAALTGAMLEDLGTRWLSGEPIDPAVFATLRSLTASGGFTRLSPYDAKLVTFRL
jgi:hypothetical protein